MPRKPRLQAAGLPVHIIQRGNNRQACFFAEEDYLFFLDHLAKLAKRFRCSPHAYALMTNHFHLLLTSESGFRSVAAHEVPRPALRPVCEPNLQTQWLFMGGAISIEPGADGALCPRLLSLYRIEPGTGQYGEASRRLSLEQLRLECRWGRSIEP